MTDDEAAGVKWIKEEFTRLATKAGGTISLECTSEDLPDSGTHRFQYTVGGDRHYIEFDDEDVTDCGRRDVTAREKVTEEIRAVLRRVTASN